MAASEPAKPGIAATADLLDLAQEAGRLGIFEWQVPAGVINFSRQFLALYDINDFDGRYETWFSYIFREDRPRVAHLIEGRFAAQQPDVQAEFRIVNPRTGALKWMEARALVIYGADGAALRAVGVSVDITERKRSIVELRRFTETLEEAVKERTQQLAAENEARQKAEAALRQAQKMEAVGQLTGGIAHDFNNLLTVVLGGLDAIGRQIPSLGDTPAAKRIARAKDMAALGAQRAVTLTSRLLAFSRQQPLDPKPIDVNRLVSSASEFLTRALGESIALETVLSAGLWTTHADANELENALLNLAVNARDAMPEGGKLTIETANCFLDDAYLTGIPEPISAGQYVLLAVVDNGIGMDKTTRERAFDPFFTTKDVGKGTGLGLSQVYGFVRQSGGHVRIYSEVGEGTAIKIYLPRFHGAETRPDRPAAARGDLGAIGAETILVAEDDDALRAFTVETLEELGYRVLQANNVAAALAVLNSPAAIDLLFTDIVMPGGSNGRQLADEALRLRPRLKVLFTTGYTRNAIVHHGRLDAGVHLISKPFSMQELGKKLRDILDAALK